MSVGKVISFNYNTRQGTGCTSLNLGWQVAGPLPKTTLDSTYTKDTSRPRMELKFLTLPGIESRLLVWKVDTIGYAMVVVFKKYCTYVNKPRYILIRKVHIL